MVEAAVVRESRDAVAHARGQPGGKQRRSARSHERLVKRHIVRQIKGRRAKVAHGQRGEDEGETVEEQHQPRRGPGAPARDAQYCKGGPDQRRGDAQRGGMPAVSDLPCPRGHPAPATRTSWKRTPQHSEKPFGSWVAVEVKNRYGVHSIAGIKKW